MRTPVRTFKIDVRLEGEWTDEECYLEEVLQDALAYLGDNVRGHIRVTKLDVDCSRQWLGMWNNP